VTRLPRGRVALGAIGLAAAAGLAMFLAPLPGVKAGAMNGLGLISVLPVLGLVGLALLIAAFTAMLALRRPVPLMLGVMLVAIVVCLDGVTAVAEPLPRFPTTYQIYGFVNYVSHAGHVAPGVSAYFSWPGFFALMSLIRTAAGLHGLLPLLTWWPVLIDTLLLFPFLLLTRALRMSWRARWFAALLFCVGNWVGQDYFSPQSFNFLLYLTFAAALLTWFGPRRAGAATPGPGLSPAVTARPGVSPVAAAGAAQAGSARPPRRVPGELPAGRVTAAQRGILLVLVVGIFAASTVSHQLTPLFMVIICAGLVLVGRCTPRGLPILFGAILVGWVSYETVGYWSGHLPELISEIGRLGGTFSASVGNRLVGTPMHKIAVDSRAAFAALMVILAVAGAVRRRLRRISDRALLVLLVAPLAIAAFQNYGGEVSLRIYLFMLPALAVLAANLFFPPARPAQAVQAEPAGPQPAGQAPAGPVPAGPEPAGPAPAGVWRSVRSAAVLALAGVLAAGLGELFLLSRYGNEAFERTPPGELAAVNYIYRHRGVAVLWLSRPAGLGTTPQMPWQYHRIASVNFASVRAPVDPADIASIVGYLKRQGAGAYLVTVTTEATFIRQSASYPPDWERNFREALSGAPGLQLMLSNRDAAVYRARLPASAPRARPPVNSGTGPSVWTIWSPVGLVALFVSLLLLTARELVRECLPARRWLMRPLALASVPAVVLLLAAVIERFRILALPVPGPRTAVRSCEGVPDEYRSRTGQDRFPGGSPERAEPGHRHQHPRPDPEGRPVSAACRRPRRDQDTRAARRARVHDQRARTHPGRRVALLHRAVCQADDRS